MIKPNQYNEIENWLDTMLPTDKEGKRIKRDMIHDVKKVKEKLNLLWDYFWSVEKQFTISTDNKFIWVTILKTNVSPYKTKQEVKR
jgi:hypothetical protein